jgi:hypothetical protein
MSSKKIAALVAQLKKWKPAELKKFWIAAIDAKLPGIAYQVAESYLWHKIDVYEKAIYEHEKQSAKHKRPKVDYRKTMENVDFFILQLKDPKKYSWKELGKLSKANGTGRTVSAIRIALTRMPKNLGYRTPGNTIAAYEKDPETFKKEFIKSIENGCPISLKIPSPLPTI